MEQTLRLLEQALMLLLSKAFHRQEWQKTPDGQHEEITIDIAPVINLVTRLDDFDKGCAEEQKDEYLNIVAQTVDAFVQCEILHPDTTHEETIILGTRSSSQQGFRFTQALEAYILLRRPAQQPQ